MVAIGTPRRHIACAGPSRRLRSRRRRGRRDARLRRRLSSAALDLAGPALGAGRCRCVYAEVRADMPGDQRANLLAVPLEVPRLRRPDQLRRQGRRRARPAGQADDRQQARLLDRDQALVRRPAGRARSRRPMPSLAGRPARRLRARQRPAATAWLKTIAPSDATHETVGGVDLTEVGHGPADDQGAWGVDGSVLLAGTSTRSRPRSAEDQQRPRRQRRLQGGRGGPGRRRPGQRVRRPEGLLQAPHRCRPRC